MILPTLLTLVRLIISPFVMPISIVYFINNTAGSILIALLFIMFAVTDFFDGYVARTYNLQSELGAQLDPIADKFFIISTYISLLYVNRMGLALCLIIVLRELFVMSVRQIALESGFVIKVNGFGKAKTLFQCVLAVERIMYNILIPNVPFMIYVDWILVMLALILTIYSGLVYAYGLHQRINLIN